MKKFLRNPRLGPSWVSLIILCVFIFLAIGSFQLDYLLLNMTVDKEYLGNGKYKETEHHQHKDAYKTIEGKQDGHGRWHGQIKIQWLGTPAYMEEATMEHGVRQGLCTKTYYPNGPVVEEHYLNGIRYEYKKSAGKMDASAFQRLNDRYPWYLLNLNGWGFDNESVKAYMDTIEARLYAQTFEPWEFDDYYDEIMSDLQDTPLDTLVEFNSDLLLLNGITNMKNSELRLAVVDCYRSEGNTIYNIINTTYPGYLVALNDSGIVSMDFEVFCQDLEDTLESYGAFDPEDPFYTDTVDSRLFNAMIALVDLESSLTALSGLSGKSATNLRGFDIHETYTALNSLKKPFRITAKPESSSSEVAAEVLAIMFMQLYESDMIRKAVRETYLQKMAILTVPTTATAFISSNSSGTIVEGYVLEDGGAEVTERGIAWATHYNPTTGNTTEVPDSQTGTFSVTINGLTAGATYYARSFAINSKGTGYGNCVSFVAGEPVGIRDKDALSADFRIYPNPAAALTTFNFTLESVENVTLTIINAKGRWFFKTNREPCE